MNKKYLWIGMFVLIGALAVSAFSWAAVTRVNNASLQRGRQADAARYTAMAEYYAAQNDASLQRGRQADAARYTAMAKFYEAQNSQVGDLTQYYISERSSYVKAAALGANQQGMDIYHQSEWNSVSVQVVPFHNTAPGM